MASGCWREMTSERLGRKRGIHVRARLLQNLAEHRQGIDIIIHDQHPDIRQVRQHDGRPDLHCTRMLSVVFGTGFRMGDQQRQLDANVVPSPSPSLLASMVPPCISTM